MPFLISKEVLKNDMSLISLIILLFGKTPDGTGATEMEAGTTGTEDSFSRPSYKNKPTK